MLNIICYGNRSKLGGPAYNGQGVVKGALVWNSAGGWRGGENLAGRGRGRRRREVGGAQLQLQVIKA